jgi:glycosyltransferase involved in cell wall biosynthesis
MHVAATVAHRLAGQSAGALALKLTNPILRPAGHRIDNAGRRHWYARAFARAFRVLTITASGKDELAAAFPAIANKLRVVDNPYITDAMLALGERREFFEPGRLLAIGRLVPQKNYPLMLEALALVRERPWNLDILGDGPLQPELERLAADLGIANRVTFQGFVEEPLPFFARAHALILSSAWEGQGAVLLEALASGCPVIATRSTAPVAEMLGQGRFGRLVDADAKALADAIRRELEDRTPVSPDARAFVERYRMTAGVQSHVEALDLGGV